MPGIVRIDRIVLGQPGRAVVRRDHRQTHPAACRPASPPWRPISRLDRHLKLEPETLRLDQDRRRNGRGRGSSWPTSSTRTAGRRLPRHDLVETAVAFKREMMDRRYPAGGQASYAVPRRFWLTQLCHRRGISSASTATYQPRCGPASRPHGVPTHQRCTGSL